MSGTLTDLLREIFASGDGAASSWDAALHAGAVIGRFELVREVGHGGFGSVWEARDTGLKRSVAFKAIRLSSREIADEQALAEAEAAAHLSHPSIVTLHDIGRSEHGIYLVMELLEGRDLGAAVERGPLPVAEAVRIATEIARGLAHAHERGVLHRDLTPRNVFLCAGGTVKILDLGLSAFQRGGAGSVRGRGGTPGYTPPERERGEPEDARSDLFGLGAILHRMLSGSRFTGSVAAGAVRLPGPPRLASLVRRLLDGDPGRRPASATEALAELEALAAGLAEEGPSRRHSGGRRRWMAMGVLGLAALAVAGLVRGWRPAAAGAATSLTVTAARPVIGVGERTGMIAAATMQDGARVPARAPAWTSSDPSVASVSAAGEVTGLSAGTATIMAVAGPVSGSASVAVSGPEWELVASSTLAPPPAGAVMRSGALGGQEVSHVYGRDAWYQTSDWAFLFVPLALPEGTDLFAVQADFHLPPVTGWTRGVSLAVFTDPGVKDPADLAHGRGVRLGQLAGDVPRYTWGVPEGWTTTVTDAEGELGTPLTGRWRTLRIEGSRSRCWFRVLLDGATVHAGEGCCDLGGSHVMLGTSHGGRNPVDGAWSNLRVFRGVPPFGGG